MKLLVKPNLWLIVHENEVEKANGSNKGKEIAGYDKEDNMYVYKKPPAMSRYEITDLYYWRIDDGKT